MPVRRERILAAVAWLALCLVAGCGGGGGADAGTGGSTGGGGGSGIGGGGTGGGGTGGGGTGGGGTGGGGSGGTSRSAISLSPSSVTATAAQGSAATLTLTITLDRQVITGDLYLGARDLGGYIDTFDVVPTSNTQGTVMLGSDPTLPMGAYSGTLEFRACKDSNCAGKWSDDPPPVSYTINVGPPPPAATVSPTTLNLSTEVGDALGVTVGLDFRPGISTSTFKVVDPSGRFASAVAATNNGGGHYSLGLTVLPPAATGTFSGTIGLRLCGSADCIASADLAGSPLQVAYTLTVSPYTGLVSPPTASGLPEWETFQGNAAHTGFVPVTLDPARFAQRWQWTMPATLNGSPSPVTTGSGVALVSSASYFQPATLFALDEADGSVKWSHDFGSIFAANHPATGGGRAFVATSGHADTFMWSFDLLTGEQKFKTQFDSQWEHYLAPVFRNGYVYTDGGPYGGMFRFKAATGTRSWFGSLGQYDLWSPAVDDNRAYAYTGYMMSALDVNTGIPVRSISDPTFNWRGYALNLSPVLPGDGSVLVVNGIYAFPQPSRNELVRFDMDAGTAMWRMQGMFASNPVVDGNTVFVANSSTRQLEARSLADGTLLWAWQPESGTETLPVGNLVLTRNLVFVSTSAATRAIDRTTHQVVWSAPQLGALAISSNSVLYISNTSQTSGPARTVTSYSLQ